MADTLRLSINRPPRQLFPILARTVRQGGAEWRLRAERGGIVWQPQTGGGELLDVRLRLEPGREPGGSLLLIEPLGGSPELEEAIVALVARLRAQALDVQPLLSEEGEPPLPAALFPMPPQAHFGLLASELAPLLERFGLNLTVVNVQGRPAHELDEALRGAALLLAPWEEAGARRLLERAASEGRPAIALLRHPQSAAAWRGVAVVYAQPRDKFLAALERALAGALVASPPPVLVAPTPEPQGAAARAAIYQGVAMDPAAPPSQRFHAARVLGDSGAGGAAAEVLGQLALAGPGELRDEALHELGALGPVALPTLWRLDAQGGEPEWAVAVAARLAEAGDVQTALFRLEWLARHEVEAVRHAALAAMTALGPVAGPRLASLLRHAEDAQVRLGAARSLAAWGSAADELAPLLQAVANELSPAGAAREAVELLAALPGRAAPVALRDVARFSPNVEAQVAAAEALHRAGETLLARQLLLGLAQGGDDVAAGAALDLLTVVSDEATADAARLMKRATLRSVRRRAAELLSEPLQPEEVQQAAARVLLALDRPALARPVLARLAGSAGALEIRRWAARELALIGETALDELRALFDLAADPVVGQHLAEGLLANARRPEDRRRAAIWLAEHSNLPRAVEVLGDLALSARVSGSDAVQATNDLARYAPVWAGAARVLATLSSDSPHPAVRARALDLLLREHPSELPLALLVDLAVTGTLGTADRAPVMEQLAVLARPAATRIAARVAAAEEDTERRWRLLQLMSELPGPGVTSALLQLSTQAPQNRVRYIAAEQLIARGHERAGFAALATIAIDAPEWGLRERSLYELAQGLPATERLLASVVERTRYEESFHLARTLLSQQSGGLMQRTNLHLDRLLLAWDRWVAGLPLGWLDRLLR